MGSRPAFMGPFVDQSTWNFFTSLESNLTFFSRSFLKYPLRSASSFARLSACLMSFFQVETTTVFLSISSFSMKPSGR